MPPLALVVSLWLFALAGILFFGSEPGNQMRVRRAFLGAAVVLTVVSAIGCASNRPSTPAGTSQVVVTAASQGSSGSTSHTVSVTLTVQK